MFAHWSLALALCTMLAVGCNRVAPKVIPKAGGLLDDAAKAAPVGGQAVVNVCCHLATLRAAV